MKLTTYDINGKKTGEKNVSDTLFEASVNEELMHRAVLMRLWNARNPIANVLTRAEVNKSKKKAFKQKGTGRARRGALNTGLVRGGGVIFGPRSEGMVYHKDMNKKERRAALFSALTAKRDMSIILEVKVDTPKTKPFSAFLEALDMGKKYLFVLPNADENTVKSIRNLPNSTYIRAEYSNPYDILKADGVVYVNDAVDVLERQFVKIS